MVKHMKSRNIRLILLTIFFVGCYYLLTIFPKLSLKENEQLDVIVMPSPPNKISYEDEECITSIIDLINNCEKHFSGFSFSSGWQIHIRYLNQSYFVNEASIRKGVRVWNIDTDTYKRISQLFKSQNDNHSNSINIVH